MAATYIIKSLATASRAILFLTGVFMIETVWQIMKWVMKWPCQIMKWVMKWVWQIMKWVLANYEMGYEMDPGKL